MNPLILALLLTVGLTACREDAIEPTAQFNFTYAVTNGFPVPTVYPTHEPFKIVNNSKDAVSYRWDFGNGQSSTEEEPVFLYQKSGRYTISLTATSSTGKQQVTTQTITVVDRVLKQIRVEYLRWDALGNLPGWPSNKTAGLQVEIGQRTAQDLPTSASTVLYTSDEVANVRETRSAEPATLVIPLQQRVVIEPSVAGKQLIVNVYGIDQQGKKLVYSSGASGAGFSSYLDRSSFKYVLRTGVGGAILRLDCDFE